MSLDISGEDFGNDLGDPVICLVLIKLLIRDAFGGEVHDSRSRATCTNLAANSRVCQIDMRLVAAFDCSHRKLCFSVNIEGLALEELNLRYDLVSADGRLLTRLNRDVLALADQLNLALVAVEEFEADAFVDLIWVIEANCLIHIVLYNPLVSFKSAYRRCRWLLAAGCLSRGWLRWSGLLFFLWSSCCSRRRC